MRVVCCVTSYVCLLDPTGHSDSAAVCPWAGRQCDRVVEHHPGTAGGHLDVPP